MKGFMGIAALLTAGFAAGPAFGADPWMTDEGGVLQLMLAHDEKSGPDGGMLTIDRNKKTVTWAGAPGEHGCKLKVETTLDGIRSVKDNGREAGFVLEMKDGKPKKLVLLPLPYAQWFVMQWQVAEGSFGKNLPEGTLRTGGRGDDGGGSMSPSGSAANAGPSVKHQDIPEQVEEETGKAITAVRDALGAAVK
jgi:hypothetical protein